MISKQFAARGERTGATRTVREIFTNVSNMANAKERKLREGKGTADASAQSQIINFPGFSLCILLNNKVAAQILFFRCIARQRHGRYVGGWKLIVIYSLGKKRAKRAKRAARRKGKKQKSMESLFLVRAMHPNILFANAALIFREMNTKSTH